MKLLFAILFVVATLPAAIAAPVVAFSTQPRPAPAAPLFSWVPPDGFPDRYPYGQCTWWAAYNHRVTWSGNAADWLWNASAQGVETSPVPSVGAIAVYRRAAPYDPDYGHVAVVIAVTPAAYTVSEMNFIGWGQVSTRVIAWPDRQVEGFIPLRQEDFQ